jgi:hypothetical protein
MNIVQKILSDGEYYKKVVEKNTIYFHHTAGSHRPDWTIDGWERDRTKSGARLAVGTAYVIGGIDRATKNNDYDGIIYQAFDDKYWAYHLGIKAINNDILNAQSIGIEICNYGPLTKTNDGIYLTYVNSAVPADMVIDLGNKYRGFQYYQKYTDRQLIALRELTLNICQRHTAIDPKKGILQFLNSGASAFEVNQAAQKGVSGIWSHSNVRADKYDVYPHPQLIELLKSL